MDWIVLHCNIADLSEEIYPFDGFTQKVSHYHSLAASPGKPPSLLIALYLRLEGKLVEIRQHLRLFRVFEVDSKLVFFTEPR